MVADGQVTRKFSIMGSTLSPLGNANATAQVRALKPGQSLGLRREPKNPHDKNAVLVFGNNLPLGYLPRGLAAKIAPLMDAGQNVVARKARDALYGVCEIAYIPAEPETGTTVDPSNFSMTTRPKLTNPKETPDA